MIDSNEPLFNGMPEQHPEPAGQVVEPVLSAESETAAGPENRFAEAGRKGAERIHQLIRHGKLYEQEHGLTSGRQRLRQLIEEGKLYEQEHGLRLGKRRLRADPSRRLKTDQVLTNLLRTLQRMVKPAYRARLAALLEALEEPRP
jgi:hypothetical protein